MRRAAPRRALSPALSLPNRFTTDSHSPFRIQQVAKSFSAGPRSREKPEFSCAPSGSSIAPSKRVDRGRRGGGEQGEEKGKGGGAPRGVARESRVARVARHARPRREIVSVEERDSFPRFVIRFCRGRPYRSRKSTRIIRPACNDVAFDGRFLRGASVRTARLTPFHRNVIITVIGKRRFLSRNFSPRADGVCVYYVSTESPLPLSCSLSLSLALFERSGERSWTRAHLMVSAGMGLIKDAFTALHPSGSSGPHLYPPPLPILFPPASHIRSRRSSFIPGLVGPLLAFLGSVPCVCVRLMCPKAIRRCLAPCHLRLLATSRLKGVSEGSRRETPALFSADGLAATISRPLQPPRSVGALEESPLEFYRLATNNRSRCSASRSFLSREPLFV